MLGFVIFISIILGTALGCAFAFFAVMVWVCSSNKIGDSKGEFKNFARRPMEYICKRESSRRMI